MQKFDDVAISFCPVLKTEVFTLQAIELKKNNTVSKNKFQLVKLGLDRIMWLF